MKVSKSQDLFFKAGKYTGKAEVFRLMREQHCNSSFRWAELNEAVEYWRAKAARYKKRAEKAAEMEKHESE